MGSAEDTFIKRVEAYCQWAEGDTHTVLEARQHLLGLLELISESDRLSWQG